MKKLFTALMLVLALVAPFAAAQTYTSPEYQDGDVVMSDTYHKIIRWPDESIDIKVSCPPNYYAVDAWMENDKEESTGIHMDDFEKEDKVNSVKWNVRRTGGTWNKAEIRGTAYALCRDTSRVDWVDVMKLDIGDADFRIRDNDADRYKVDDIIIGEDLKVKLTFEAKEDVENIFIEYKFSGSEFESESLRTNKFNVDKDTIYTKTFVVNVPEEFEEGEEGVLGIKLGKEEFKRINLQPKLVFKKSEKIETYEETLVTEAEVIASEANEIISQSDKALVISVADNFQEVKAGETAEFSMLLTNKADSVKTYMLKTEEIEWADAQLSNNIVVLEPQESKKINLYLAAKKETEGLQEIAVTVLSNTKALKDVNFNAFVIGTDGTEESSTFAGTDTVKILEVSLIVLVIILVLLLVIVGLTKMRKKDDDDLEDDDENYY